MTVRYSQYAQKPFRYAGTALAASGTVIPPTSNGERILLDYITYWLVDPAASNTVTLALGTVTLPAVGLSSSRGAFSMQDHVFDANAGLTVTLASSGTVGFFGRYVVASDT